MTAVTSWSPSRLDKYKECPLKFKLVVLEKLCGSCFAGKIRGGYDKPAVCDSCGNVEEIAAPLARGSVLDANATKYIMGESATLNPEVKRHPKVHDLLKDLRASRKKKVVQILTQKQICLTETWEATEPTPWNKKAWFRGALDCLVINGTSARVYDWKSGGIDKNTGNVRGDQKYDDQIFAYNVAVLCAYPQVEVVQSALVFFDCGPRFEPIISRPELDLKRDDLEKAKKTWGSKLKAYFSDKSFSPKPGHYCGWCPYAKKKGGPCKF